MRTFCGVDVSKAMLDAFVDPVGVHERFSNDAEGISALGAFCRVHGVDLVAMEATGGHERTAWLLLWEAGVACAVVNAARVRLHARAFGLLEKTDRIDAQMIASFARTTGLVAGAPPGPGQQRLKGLVARLGQVTEDLTTNKRRLSSCQDSYCRASLCETIAFLGRQARQLEGGIASMIDDDPTWGRLAEAFSQIKGVARRTIATLLAELPEIGQISNKAISKLAGLAPLADDSGKRRGQRHISGGRQRVRTILHVISIIAARFDKSLAEFNQRLIKAGKPKMVVRIALAHKILVRLNAKAREARMQMLNAT